MATTHLKKIRKFDGATRPACRMANAWRNSSTSYDTTDVQADVDCTRCAKLEGFAPKAKKASANPGGTCQVCFAEQRVVGGKTMALHGYNRPGIGHIIGDCRGSKRLPFEKACNLTKAHRAHIAADLEDDQKFLAKLNAGEVETLRYDAETTERDPNYQAGIPFATRYLHQTFHVVKGQKTQYGLAGLRGAVPSYADLLERKVFNVKARIAHMVAELGFLDGKLAGWAVKELLP